LLATFSIILCAANAAQHLIEARGTKAVLSIMQPGDQRIERVERDLQAHYRIAEAAMAVIVAQAILISLLIRERHQRHVP
jgi:L-fucose isomerase-like protein